MNFLLRYPLVESDLDFLNSTSIDYKIFNTHGFAALTEVNLDRDMHDSGWCDYTTNARIISNQDRVVFKNVSETEKTLLVLKYGDRLKELTVGFKEIYNIDKID